MILEDDKGVFPAGATPLRHRSQATVDEAGPDFQATIEAVQEGLTEEVMQELNARVDIDQRGGHRGRHAVPAGVRATSSSSP